MMPLIAIMIFVWTMSFYMDTTFLALSTENPVGILTFSFVHISLLHLVINCIMLVSYWRLVRNLNMWKVIPIIVFSTLFAGLLSAKAEPTIGASALAMAILGVGVSRMPKDYMISMIIVCVVTFAFAWLIMPNFNFGIHFYSFFVSFLISITIGRCFSLQRL